MRSRRVEELSARLKIFEQGLTKLEVRLIHYLEHDQQDHTTQYSTPVCLVLHDLSIRAQSDPLATPCAECVRLRGVSTPEGQVMRAINRLIHFDILGVAFAEGIESLEFNALSHFEHLACLSTTFSPGITTAQLCRRFRRKQSQVLDTLDDLENQGYLYRITRRPNNISLWDTIGRDPLEDKPTNQPNRDLHTVWYRHRLNSKEDYY